MVVGGPLSAIFQPYVERLHTFASSHQPQKPLPKRKEHNSTASVSLLTMPIDINELRDYKGGDPAKWRKYMAARFKPVEWVDEVIAKDEEWRNLQI